MQGTLNEIIQTILDTEISITLIDEKFLFTHDYQGMIILFDEHAGRTYKLARHTYTTIEQFTDLRLNKVYRFTIKGI